MIRFPLATSSWDDAEQAALQRVIASDRYSMGPEVAAFEADFARFTGSRYAVMVNSGSSANLAMVAALRYTQNPDLRLMPGDEVIVPAVSWSTTYFPLHQYGLHLKFVDIAVFNGAAHLFDFKPTGAADIFGRSAHRLAGGVGKTLFGTSNHFG